MSEYAIRKSDGKYIYIGSCDEMCCLRYEDREKVIPQSESFDIGSCTGLHWRLPVPEEDGVLPGEYDGCVYYRKDEKYNFFYIPHHCQLDNTPGYFKGIVEHPGSFQLVSHALGLLVNIKCYHGFKINESNDEASFGWNSKSRVMCLCGVKNEEHEMKLLYTCVACDSKWSVSFPKIQHLIRSEEMKLRLFILCSAYWEERNSGKYYPFVMSRRKSETQVISLARTTNGNGDNYAVTWSGQTTVEAGTSFFRESNKAFEAYLNK